MNIMTVVPYTKMQMSNYLQIVNKIRGKTPTNSCKPKTRSEQKNPACFLFEWHEIKGKNVCEGWVSL